MSQSSMSLDTSPSDVEVKIWTDGACVYNGTPRAKAAWAFVSDDLAMYFAEIGYDPLFGARPLRRAIDEKLVDEVAMRIIEGRVKPGDTLAPKIKESTIVI